MRIKIITKKILERNILINPRFFISIFFIYNHFIARNMIKIRKGNKLELKFAILKKINIQVKGNSNLIKIGRLSRLSFCQIYIGGNRNIIEILDNVNLNQTEIHIEGDNNLIQIGNSTTIHGNTHIAAIESTKIIIGNDCMFSKDIHITTGDSHSIIDLNGIRINPSKDILIGDHVWIGTQVICLKGVKIANNCIVGAGSLLNKQYNEPNSILAGNPAKIIKDNISWDRKRL